MLLFVWYQSLLMSLIFEVSRNAETKTADITNTNKIIIDVSWFLSFIDDFHTAKGGGYFLTTGKYQIDLDQFCFDTRLDLLIG